MSSCRGSPSPIHSLAARNVIMSTINMSPAITSMPSDFTIRQTMLDNASQHMQNRNQNPQQAQLSQILERGNSSVPTSNNGGRYNQLNISLEDYNNQLMSGSSHAVQQAMFYQTARRAAVTMATNQNSNLQLQATGSLQHSPHISNGYTIRQPNDNEQLQYQQQNQQQQQEQQMSEEQQKQMLRSWVAANNNPGMSHMQGSHANDQLFFTDDGNNAQPAKQEVVDFDEFLCDQNLVINDREFVSSLHQLENCVGPMGQSENNNAAELMRPFSNMMTTDDDDHTSSFSSMIHPMNHNGHVNHHHHHPRHHHHHHNQIPQASSQSRRSPNVGVQLMHMSSAPINMSCRQHDEPMLAPTNSNECMSTSIVSCRNNSAPAACSTDSQTITPTAVHHIMSSLNNDDSVQRLSAEEIKVLVESGLYQQPLSQPCHNGYSNVLSDGNDSKALIPLRTQDDVQTERQKPQRTKRVIKRNRKLSCKDPVQLSINWQDNQQQSAVPVSVNREDVSSISRNGSVLAIAATIATRHALLSPPAQSQNSELSSGNKNKKSVPDDLKDEKYWTRRRKNNLAAKRSRDSRRMKENQVALRAAFLERENSSLKCQIEEYKKEIKTLKHKLSRYEINTAGCGDQHQC